MDENRLRGLMGLCARAGRGVFGEDTCRRTLQGGKVFLLLMEEGISPGSAEKLTRLCGKTGVPVMRIPDGMMRAAGRNGRVMAVSDGSFARQMAACGGDMGSPGETAGK